MLSRISVESKMYWNYPPEWLAHWMDELTLSEDDFESQSIYKLELSGSVAGFCALKKAASFEAALRNMNKNYQS